MPQQGGPRNAEDEDLSEERHHAERRLVAAELRTQLLNQSGDDAEVTAHEAFVKDVEGLGRRLLLAHDQLHPGVGARIGMQAHDAFDELQEMGDALFALRQRQCRVGLEL